MYEYRNNVLDISLLKILDPRKVCVKWVPRELTTDGFTVIQIGEIESKISTTGLRIGALSKVPTGFGLSDFSCSQKWENGHWIEITETLSYFVVKTKDSRYKNGNEKASKSSTTAIVGVESLMASYNKKRFRFI